MGCSECPSSLEQNNYILKIDAINKKSNQFIVATSKYTQIPWNETALDTIRITSNSTRFTQTSNNQPSYAPGAKVKVVIFTNSGSFTSNFAPFNPNGTTDVSIFPEIPTNQIREIFIQYYNINKYTGTITVDAKFFGTR